MINLPSASVSIGQEGEKALIIKDSIEFMVSKTEASFSNKAQIKLKNLSQESISLITKENSFLQLKVLHEGHEKVIFTGDIDSSALSSSGPDDILTIETGDGEKKLKSSLEFELPKGSQISEMFQLAASALGVPTGVIKGLPDGKIKRSRSFAGAAKDLLDELCRQFKLSWSVQDGVLKILPEADKLNLSAIIINPDSGILDSISKDDDKRQVTVKCSLNPGITPGRLVELTSGKYAGTVDAISGKSGGTGLFKVLSLTHKGNPEGADWVTSFTATLWTGG